MDGAAPARASPSQLALFSWCRGRRCIYRLHQEFPSMRLFIAIGAWRKNITRSVHYIFKATRLAPINPRTKRLFPRLQFRLILCQLGAFNDFFLVTVESHRVLPPIRKRTLLCCHEGLGTSLVFKTGKTLITLSRIFHLLSQSQGSGTFGVW